MVPVRPVWRAHSLDSGETQRTTGLMWPAQQQLKHSKACPALCKLLALCPVMAYVKRQQSTSSQQGCYYFCDHPPASYVMAALSKQEVREATV